MNTIVAIIKDVHYSDAYNNIKDQLIGKRINAVGMHYNGIARLWAGCFEFIDGYVLTSTDGDEFNSGYALGFELEFVKEC